MARAPIPVKGAHWTVDTRKALALLNQVKAEAARANIAIEKANTILAQRAQRYEAKELQDIVAERGRPQRHSQRNGGLSRVLTDERNRTVSASKYVINDPTFLDNAAIYWRQLEHGYRGRTQLVSGLFAEPRRATNPRARYASIGSVSGPRRPIERGSGDVSGPIDDPPHTAHRLLQYRVSRSGRPAPKFRAAVGPRRAFRYIDQGLGKFRREWLVSGRAVGTYRRAMRAEGIQLLSQFRSAHGRGLSGTSDLADY